MIKKRKVNWIMFSHFLFSVIDLIGAHRWFYSWTELENWRLFVHPSKQDPYASKRWFCHCFSFWGCRQVEVVPVWWANHSVYWQSFGGHSVDLLQSVALTDIFGGRWSSGGEKNCMGHVAAACLCSEIILQAQLEYHVAIYLL